MKAGQIIELRLRAGLTQAATAERLGVSREQYVRWETGRNVVKPMVVLALERLLELSHDHA